PAEWYLSPPLSCGPRLAGARVRAKAMLLTRTSGCNSRVFHWSRTANDCPRRTNSTAILEGRSSTGNWPWLSYLTSVARPGVPLLSCQASHAMRQCAGHRGASPVAVSLDRLRLWSVDSDVHRYSLMA